MTFKSRSRQTRTAIFISFVNNLDISCSIFLPDISVRRTGKRRVRWSWSVSISFLKRALYKSTGEYQNLKGKISGIFCTTNIYKQIISWNIRQIWWLICWQPSILSRNSKMYFFPFPLPKLSTSFHGLVESGKSTKNAYQQVGMVCLETLIQIANLYIALLLYIHIFMSV